MKLAVFLVGWMTLLLASGAAAAKEVRQRRTKREKDVGEDDKGKGKGKDEKNKGTYGVQKDCYDNDDTKFNICLDLNILDPTAVPTTQGGFQECWRVVSRINGMELTPRCGKTPYAPNDDKAIYDSRWMDAAIEAKKVFEKLIEDDTVPKFPLLQGYKSSTTGNVGPFAFPEGTSVPYTTLRDENLNVDDIFIIITNEDDTINDERVIAKTFLPQLSALVGDAPGTIFPLICNIVLNKNSINEFIENGQMFGILLHEFFHCLGLDPTPLRGNAGQTGRAVQGSFVSECLEGRTYTTWEGEAALEQWKDLGCDGPLPMATSFDPEGPAPDIHLDKACLNQALFTQFYDPVDFIFSPIEAGMLDDIGYSVDYGVTEKFKLKDLGGEVCAEFCPAVAKSCAKKSKKRNLNQDNEEDSAKKGISKNGGGRRLKPSKGKIIPTFSEASTLVVEAPIPEEEEEVEVDVPAVFTPTKSAVDAFYRMVYRLHQNLPGVSADQYVSALMRGENGTTYDLQASFAEAEEYILNHPIGEVTV